MLHVFPPCGRAGTETVLRTLIAGFRSEGVESEAFFQRDLGGGELFQALCPTHFQAEQSLAEVLRTGRFDLIHAVASSITIGVREAVRDAGFSGPVVVSCHGDYILGWRRGNASALITLTDFWARKLRPFTDLAIHVIGNPVDCSRFSPPTDPPDGTTGPPIVGWVGRLADPHKNTALLKAVMGAVSREPYRFHLADTDAVVDLDGELGALRAQVDRSGHVHPDEMPAFYRRIARSRGVLLFTSVREAFPMAVLEAMASGCPVIVPDAWGSTEIIGEDEAGWIVPTAEGVDGVRRALEAARDGVTWERRSRGARARALAHYSQPSVVQSYLSVFRGLEHPRGSPNPRQQLAWALRSLAVAARPLPQAVWRYRPRRAVESIDRALSLHRAGADSAVREELLDALASFPPAFLKPWRLKFLLKSLLPARKDAAS